MRTRISHWAILSQLLLAATLLLCSTTAWAQADCTPGLGFECDTNRGGSDYAASDLPQASPQMCAQACAGDNSCRAWTYVRPGVQGPYARCYLKNPAPAPTANNCCISGAVGRVIDQQVNFEVNTNRGGSDYLRFELQVANPDLCFQQCRGDNRCAAWTFVRPGVQGALAVCYLKNPAPAPTADGCCVSGAIPGFVSQPVTPPPPPPPPPQSGNCWLTSNTFIEQHEGGPTDWRGVYTRRGGNVFDVTYTRPGETKVAQLTLDVIGNPPTQIRVKRNDYDFELGSNIVGPGVAHGAYAGGTKFSLSCGG